MKLTQVKSKKEPCAPKPKQGKKEYSKKKKERDLGAVFPSSVVELRLIMQTTLHMVLFINK